MTEPRVLYVVVCGAGPASDVGTFVTAAHAEDWDVHLITTPAGLEFLDLDTLESQTGHPVRSAYRSPEQPRHRMPPADAIIVAPATYNTINKLAAGIADNYALGVLAECIGLHVPVVIVPFLNSALASRAPLQAAVAALRAEGVTIHFGPGKIEPHPPHQGGPRISTFPWTQALAEARRSAAAGLPWHHPIPRHE